MKKIFLLFFVLIIITACNRNNNPDNSLVMNKQNSVDDVLKNQVAKLENDDVKETENQMPISEKTDQNIEVDVDLTLLSSTMVYSEVYDMMYSPKKYIGKTIRMKGLFANYWDEELQEYRFGCIITDATACCGQGIEFVLKEKRNYPEDFPELGKEITIVGLYDCYQDGSFVTSILNDAIME